MALPALLTFLCAMAVASPAWAHTIVVVRPDASDPILTEVFSRLCGELHMYGLKVDVAGSEEVAPPAGVQRTEDAGSTEIVGGISLLRTPGQATAKIWIAEASTGKEGLRITVSIDDADAPSLLAVRAVDLVRASLRDADLAEREQPETKPATTAGVSRSTEAPSPAAPDGFERWAIRGGATTLWETGDLDLIKKETLRKLNAAKRGGFIFQSDHSVSSDVSGKTYDYIVKLVREYGKYPLNLGAFDIEMKI